MSSSEVSQKKKKKKKWSEEFLKRTPLNKRIN